MIHELIGNLLEMQTINSCSTAVQPFKGEVGETRKQRQSYHQKMGINGCLIKIKV